MSEESQNNKNCHKCFEARRHDKYTKENKHSYSYVKIFLVIDYLHHMSKPSPIEQYVIDKVKERRLALGITQKELSFLLEVSEGYIGLVESPNTDDKYSLKRLNDLARVLNCSPKDFLPEGPL